MALDNVRADKAAVALSVISRPPQERPLERLAASPSDDPFESGAAQPALPS